MFDSNIILFQQMNGYLVECFNVFEFYNALSRVEDGSVPNFQKVIQFVSYARFQIQQLILVVEVPPFTTDLPPLPTLHPPHP